MKSPVVVTGGLGFIGSGFIRALVGRGISVINVDTRTYAADDRRLSACDDRLLSTVVLDIADPSFAKLLVDARAASIVHLAAETHVTRSETAADLFYRTNVEGTRAVLEAAVQVGVPSVLHVSTDEVYGPCPSGAFYEDDKEPGEGRATSPYAKSKAVADDLVQSFSDVLRVTIVRPTNCFGAWQHPEKAVARWITRALRGLPLPVWGDGGQIRDWMYLDDVCAALFLLLEREVTGIYNIAPENDNVTNLEIATEIARLAGTDGAAYLTAYDRPNHDARYAVDSKRLRALGWSPSLDVSEGLIRTINWYRRNEAWWKPLLEEAEAIYSDKEVSRAN